MDKEDLQEIKDALFGDVRFYKDRVFRITFNNNFVLCRIQNLYAGFVEIFPTYDISGKILDNRVQLIPVMSILSIIEEKSEEKKE